MKATRFGSAAAAALILGLTGCAGDVATQFRTNAQVRERVMDAIAADSQFTQQMADRLLANDTLRTRVIETVLHDSRCAQYVLARIGRNPDAVDLVLQVAVTDSVGREHVRTLMKGMQLGLKAGH